MLVDFPGKPAGTVPTLEDDAEAQRRAHVSTYAAESIINRRAEKHDGGTVTTLIVLTEKKEIVQDGGFEVKTEHVYRVLRLLNGHYLQQLYDEKDNIIETIEPTDAASKPWMEILFVMAGTETSRL